MELGEDRFLEALKKVSFESALTAGRLPCNDFAAFNASMCEPDHFGQHILALDIVEDTPHAIEVKVTECLWAKTFREMGAAGSRRNGRRLSRAVRPLVRACRATPGVACTLLAVRDP